MFDGFRCDGSAWIIFPVVLKVNILYRARGDDLCFTSSIVVHFFAYPTL